MLQEPKYPRVSLTQDDGRWVAAAAAFAGETPKFYIERVLLPIANEIVETGLPIVKPFAPSPSTNSPRSFSVSPADFGLLVTAAEIEGLTMKRFAEKHLVPVARREVIARVRESQQKAA